MYYSEPEWDNVLYETNNAWLLLPKTFYRMDNRVRVYE